MIDLRRLAVLRAVAHYGTVTAAAEAVHMTPSAASQHLRRLGRELDVSLLEPNGRRVRLTPAARSLLRHADRMETYWQEAEAELHAAASPGLRGELRMAGMPTAVSALLAPLTARLRRDEPELTVTLREAEPRECYDLLFSGETDLAVVEATEDSPPLNDGRFDQQTLLDDPYDLLTHAGHPLADRPGTTLGDLAGEQWIVGMCGTSCRQLVQSACNAAGFTPEVAHQAREWTVVATLVAHGLGIALVPRVTQLPSLPEAVRTPLTGADCPSRRFLSVIRSGSGDHPALVAARSLLDSLAKDVLSTHS